MINEKMLQYKTNQRHESAVGFNVQIVMFILQTHFKGVKYNVTI